MAGGAFVHRDHIGYHCSSFFNRHHLPMACLAGKIAGAGGGGFLLLLVPREKQNAVFEAMQDYRELPFMLEPSGSKVIFEDRSYSSK